MYMTQKFYLLSKSLLTKIALVAALMSWGGIAAEADDVIYNGEGTIPTGWTGSDTKIANNEIVGTNTWTPYNLISESAIFAPNQTLVLTVRGTRTTSARIQIYTSSTGSFDKVAKEYTSEIRVDTDNAYELIYRNTSANTYYLKITGSYAAIQKIEILDPITSLTLDEGTPTDFSSLTVATSIPTVTVKYTAKNGWNTICMPFQLRTWSVNHMNSIFGTGWSAYTLSSYSSNTLTFTAISGSGYIQPNTPMLVNAPNASGEQVTLNLTNIEVTYSANPSTPANGITFQGTYAPMPAGSLVGKYGVTSDGKLAKGGSGAWMKGYRAYLTGLPTGAQARIIVIDGDDETTDIGGLAQIVDDEILGKGGSKAPRAYNLQGQQVRNGKKGIYVVNGKKIVVK
ncbi:hypothetical protein [Prevotella sp. E13-27]|uniref:hypothetical protein n=1 Tax=Prevotella sp. E13-27 TaxID=2938122 RepID=UPI00200B9256|nr:hypothetical protein [Prevotella sp. E13-27]MCK8621803.1 hypothetical protein [Prevotella sp. E13-27]